MRGGGRGIGPKGAAGRHHGAKSRANSFARSSNVNDCGSPQALDSASKTGRTSLKSCARSLVYVSSMTSGICNTGSLIG